MVVGRAGGHCLCGAVHFEAEAEPLSTSLCHCESCRRHTGSVVAAFVTYPKSAVRWRGVERARYRSSPPVVRSFCGKCGSPLAYERDDTPDEIDLYLGTVDDPDRFPPEQHSHFRERVAWLDTIDHAPRYEAGSGSARVAIADEPTSVDETVIPAGQIPPVSQP